jgi:crossover junction endodeoxyribonuclease RuvC
MIYVGIDPGLKGGVAAIDSSGDVVLIERMPTMPGMAKGKAMVDGVALADLLNGCKMSPSLFVGAVELVGAMPKQGVTSSFSFGTGYGIVLGVLSALGVGYVTVPPAKWKKHHGLLKKDKNASIGLATRLWPRARIGKGADGIAEALLIADWLRFNRGE